MNSTIFDRCQWVNYSQNKVPSAPVNDPSKWLSYDQAKTNDPGHIGFVFYKDDPYFFIDLDHCVNEDGSWNNMSLRIFSMFNGCYMERSMSGMGAHVIGRAPLDLGHTCDNKTIGSQFYTQERFVALTWWGRTGSMEFTPDPETYRSFIQEYFPEKSITTTGVTGPGPVPEWSGPADDAKLIEIMLESKQGVIADMRGKPSVHDLWYGNTNNLVYKIPREHDPSDFDWSTADSCLCTHLAFWAGKDHERITRLWGMSALGARDKFRERPDYVQRTVSGACDRCSNVYNDGRTVDVNTGLAIMFPEDQVKHFAGCVLIAYPKSPMVFMPDGDEISQTTFKSLMGHKLFITDPNGQKTTKDAWEAFTNSQVFSPVVVKGTCFRPDLPTGAILNKKMVNTYVTLDIPCKEGDPRPFLDLAQRILPDERDRTILLSYMAAVIQYPGVKFQWAPVLQGTKGNGKSTIIRIIRNSITTETDGYKYFHAASANDIMSDFTGWLDEKIFIGVDETDTVSSKELMQKLKNMITEDCVSIQRKGINQVTKTSFANFIFCMNDKSNIKQDKDERRFSIFYMPQQTKSDKLRDGLSDEYFGALYNWLKKEGYAICNWYLRNYQIPGEFNPALGCNTAPITSTTHEVIADARSDLAQYIAEAIDEEKQGFRGGWISTTSTSKMLFEETGRKYNPKQIGLAIKELGYVISGRASRLIPEEGKQPYLYTAEPVNINSRTATILYCKSQGYVELI